ncbi:MAG: hypothetical protein K8W52_45480 [Deltaproteobacteria bacterium]|nr:hypothetical protein [Deltaproteobacteria bacterium]
MHRSAMIAVLVVGVGCGSGGSPSAGSGGGAGSGPGTASASAPETDAGGPQLKMITPDIRTLPEPVIELPKEESTRLLAPGAEPRAPLRYAWQAQHPREVTVEARIKSRRLDAGAWSPQAEVPAVREGFGFDAAPAADGSATLAFRGLVSSIVGDPTDADRARAGEYLAQFRQLIEHRRGTAIVDARGRLTNVRFSDESPTAPSMTARDEVAQRWLAVAVPLPDEPIGLGGSWRVVTVLRAGAAVVKQTADYTLVARTADRWTIDVALRRIGEEQLVDVPGMPRGTVAELVAMFRELKGRVVVEPSLPWPVSGALSSELRVHAKFGVPNQGVVEDITEDIGALTLTSK